MSYARFGWDGSDVYVFMSVDGTLECCGCLLQETEVVEDEDSFFGFYLNPVGEIIQSRFTSTEEMVAHLEEHIAQGYHVPESVIPNIRADDLRNFPENRDSNSEEETK